MRTICFFLVFFLGLNTSINAQIIKKATPIRAESPSVSAKIQNPKYFVQIPGITGESKDSKHRSWIELEGIDFQMMQNITNGQIAGKGSKSLKAYKNVDTSSGAIAEFCGFNNGLQKVELEIMQTIKNMQYVNMKFELTNVLISSYQLKNDLGSNDLQEEFSLEAKNISVTYFSYDSEGKLLSTKQIEVGNSMY